MSNQSEVFAMLNPTQVPSVVRVQDTDIPVVVYKDLRVVTTDLLAQLYGTEEIRIQQNFVRNDARFEEGKHFFKLEGDELTSFKIVSSSNQSINKHARNLILWTERGAARHAKMLDTDQAWAVFDKLEAAYFDPPQSPAPPSLIAPDTRFIASRVGQQWVLYEVPHNAYILPAEDWPSVIRGANFPTALVSDILAAATDRVVGRVGPAIVNTLPRPSMVPLQEPPREPRRRPGRPSSATRAIPQAQPAAEASGGLGLQDEAERVLSRILNHRVRVQPDQGPAFLWSIGELARYGSGEPLTPPGRISYRGVNRALMAYGCRVSEDRQRLIISNTHPAIEARLRDTPWSTGWYRVLKRIEGAVSEGKAYWFGGAASRAVSVPIEKVAEILANA